MHYLGLDVSKDTIDAALLTSSALITGRWKMNNTVSDITAVFTRILSTHPHLTIAVESTGRYQLPTMEAAEAAGLSCKILNPILTNQMLRGSIRKRKTDRDDAVIIAKLALQGEGRTMKTAELRDERKVIARSAIKLLHARQSLHLHRKHLQTLLGSVPEPVTMAFEAIQTARRDMQKHAITLTRGTERDLLCSIPGIAEWLATVIIAELGSRLSVLSGDQLVAFAGLDPKVRQSGATLHATGRMTKRGSPHLRWALVRAANVSRMHDPDLRRFYQKKRTEGKGHTAATCATARKLCYRIVAVLKRKSPYLATRIT
jgi:transposase